MRNGAPFPFRKEGNIMNRGQKILTGIFLVLFVLIAMYLLYEISGGPIVALGILAVVYVGVMFMLKTPAPKP